MAKKASPKKSAPKGPSAEDHRKIANKHRAMGRLHEAKADMMDAMNPPKGNKNRLMGGY